MALDLWIPESARELEEPRNIYLCRVCGLKLPRPQQRQQFIRHVKACAKKHEDEIEADLERLNSNVFSGSMDPERERWLRRRQEENVTDIDWLKEGLVH